MQLTRQIDCSIPNNSPVITLCHFEALHMCSVNNPQQANPQRQAKTTLFLQEA